MGQDPPAPNRSRAFKLGQLVNCYGWGGGRWSESFPSSGNEFIHPPASTLARVEPIQTFPWKKTPEPPTPPFQSRLGAFPSLTPGEVVGPLLENKPLGAAHFQEESWPEARTERQGTEGE